jgi:hypothetical protein
METASVVSSRSSITPQVIEVPPRKSIEGRVYIMRKSYWSVRHAQIKDAYFSYKKDKSSSDVRQIINLREAKIAKGTRSSGEPYF